MIDKGLLDHAQNPESTLRDLGSVPDSPKNVRWTSAQKAKPGKTNSNSQRENMNSAVWIRQVQSDFLPDVLDTKQGHYV